MGFISGNICFGDHAHFQERAEDKCMIIQNGLLHLYSKFCTFFYVKFRTQFFFQLIQFFTAVFSLISCRIGSCKNSKPVFRITGRCLYIGHCIDIPCSGIICYRVIVRRTVDVQINPDILQSCLCGFCKQRQFLTAWVGQPSYC